MKYEPNNYTIMRQPDGRILEFDENNSTYIDLTKTYDEGFGMRNIMDIRLKGGTIKINNLVNILKSNGYDSKRIEKILKNNIKYKKELPKDEK